MSICFGVQTWDDVDFLAVGQPVKKNFSNGLWSQKRTSYFSFYVIKRFAQIFVKVNQKMKNERVLESYIIFFTTSYHLRPVLLFSEATLLVWRVFWILKSGAIEIQKENWA